MATTSAKESLIANIKEELERLEERRENLTELLNKWLKADKNRKTLLDGLSTVADSEEKNSAEDVLEELGQKYETARLDLKMFIWFYRRRIGSLTAFLESLG